LFTTLLFASAMWYVYRKHGGIGAALTFHAPFNATTTTITTTSTESSGNVQEDPADSLHMDTPEME
jgi:hypothetical protein